MESINFKSLPKEEQEKIANECSNKQIFCSMSLLDIDPNGNIMVCNKASGGNIFDDENIYIPNIRKCEEPYNFMCMYCFNPAASDNEEELLDYLKTHNINNEIKINNI